MKVTALLDDYAQTRALKCGAVSAEGLDIEFLPGRPVSHFKRLVRTLDIDIAEIPIMTFLMGVERGLPLELLPVVVLGGFQHGFLYRHKDRSNLNPHRLEGKVIGIRAYSVTTATWLRDILEQEYGIDRALVNWLAFEEPHFSDFQNPPNVKHASEGETAEDMLERGEIDAVVLRAVPTDRPFEPMIPDAPEAGVKWRQRHGGIQINHMIAVRSEFARRHPAAVNAFMAALAGSANRDADSDPNTALMGRDAVQPSLNLAIQCALRQGIITREMSADQLLARVFQDKSVT